MAQSSRDSFAFASEPPAHLALAEERQRAVTWRSALIGTLLCGLTCGLMPFNDYVVENTIIIGSYLPLVLVIAFFILVVAVNAPLHRYAPRQALSRGELAVIMAMLLVGCSVPAQGLMRTLMPNMIAWFYHGKTEVKFYGIFTNLGLPPWLFPVHDASDRLITDFYNRVPFGESMRFAPWLLPLIGWGVFIAGLMTTLVSLAVILGPQWSTNERLAFPIAQLQAALIEPPQRGRALNDMFRNRVFWIALCSVILLHFISSGHKYFPKYVPKLDLNYDFRNIFTEMPWVYFGNDVKFNRIFFTFIGIAYFMPGRLSFSLWSIFLITEVINVGFKSYQNPIEQPAFDDQQFGASIAVLLGVMWVGRHHWASVWRQAIGREQPLPGQTRYRWSLVALLVGVGVMFGWLIAVDVQPWVALAIIAVVLMGHVIVSRVVAETGMPCLRNYAAPMQMMTNLPPSVLTGKDVFFGGIFTTQGPYTTRESLMTFSMHGLRDASPDASARTSRGVVALMAWALVFSFAVSAASWLWTYYSYSVPLTYRTSFVNELSLVNWPKTFVIDPLVQWSDGRFPVKAHDPMTHVGIGFGVAGLLQLATLRWAAWPFTPIGYLMCTNPYIRQTWFSIFLGWLLKTLIVQFGGAKMFQQARPLFIGLVFGEALAAAFWMMLNFYLAATGQQYEQVQLLPI